MNSVRCNLSANFCSKVYVSKNAKPDEWRSKSLVTSARSTKTTVQLPKTAQLQRLNLERYTVYEASHDDHGILILFDLLIVATSSDCLIEFNRILKVIF